MYKNLLGVYFTISLRASNKPTLFIYYLSHKLSFLFLEIKLEKFELEFHLETKARTVLSWDSSVWSKYQQESLEEDDTVNERIKAPCQKNIEIFNLDYRWTCWPAYKQVSEYKNNNTYFPLNFFFPTLGLSTENWNIQFLL